MKNSRKAIAITSGVIVAFGQLAVAGTHDLGPRLVVGVSFGVAIAASMIRRPERISRNHIAFVIVPLLSALVAWVAIYESENLLSTIVWVLLFLVSKVTFLMYPSSGS